MPEIGVFLSASSPRPTWAAPSEPRSTDSCATTAQRSRFSTTRGARGSTPRPGSSDATAGSTPPTSARPTCPEPLCSTASSGTSASRASERRPCSTSSWRPSRPTGTRTPSARYDPETDRDKLDDALADARGERAGGAAISLSGLELRPYPYQQAILESLESERTNHDRHRNLVVAATGTGKTVMAALDYRNLARAAGTQPNLLVRRTPARDPPAVAAHLSRSSGGRQLRRALRRRQPTRAVASRVRERPGAQPVRRREHPGRPLRCRRGRRVPSRRGAHLPAHPRPPSATRAARPDCHP